MNEDEARKKALDKVLSDFKGGMMPMNFLQMALNELGYSVSFVNGEPVPKLEDAEKFHKLHKFMSRMFPT